MLTHSFWSFALQINALKTQARKLACTLTHRSTNGDILSRKTKHLFQFVMLWKGKRKHRSYQRLSAFAKLSNDNELFNALTLITCNGVSNAWDKERTSRWFFANTHCCCYEFSMHVNGSASNMSFLMQMLLQCENQLSTSETNWLMRNIYASENYIERFLSYRFPKVALTTLLLVAKDFIYKRFCFIRKAVVGSTRKHICWLLRRYLFCLSHNFLILINLFVC